MAMSCPTEINIITLNCWGLKANISKYRKERLDEIGRQLAQTQPPPQIVCLQEVWSHDDYLAIRRSVRSLLPHGKFYHAGPFGAGLAILSHWPITSATMTPYALNGRPTAFFRGDWFVGKGIAHAALRLGPPDPDNDTDNVIDVFTTHTHAAYSSDSEDSYRVHRESQAWQLAKLLRGASTQRGNHLVIAAGDFNMAPLGPEHRILTAHVPGLRDIWRVLHPGSSLGPANATVAGPVPDAAYNLAENGVTSNSVYNTWSSDLAGKPLREPAPGTPDPRGQRLDYIWATNAAREIYYPHDTESGPLRIGGWVARDARVGMLQRHPTLGCSLSDHFSVEATLVFHTTTTPPVSREGEGEGGPPSISNWPLPPGRLSNLSAFRGAAGRSTPALAANIAATGTFLSLGHSPTSSPGTSRRPSHSSAAPRNLAADLDTQLLSSLFPNHKQFTPADYTALLTQIKLYASREADQVRLRTAHFAFWVFALVACLLAIWFIPTHTTRLSAVQNHAVNFVLLLLSSLGLVAGCLDGLMALLFFAGSEKRAVREFEWEVRNAKRIALHENGAADEEFGSGKYD